MEEHSNLAKFEFENDHNITINIKDNDAENIYVKRISGVPLWYYTFVCVVLTSIGINGILLNGLVIRGFIISPSVRTPYNAIVLNLAFAEFLLALFGVSLDIQALVQKGWVYGKNICMITGALTTTSGFASMSTLCVLSVCRYESIFRFGNIIGNVSSYRTVGTIICGIWLYSFALSLPPLFGWGRYVPEISGLACTPDWHSKNANKTYILCILIFGFITPTTIIIITSILTCVETLTSTYYVVYRSKCKRYKSNLQLLLIMNLSYLICWSPYAIMCLIHTFFSQTVIEPMLSMIPAIIVKISVCVNPILYIAYNPQFRGNFTLKSVHSKRTNKKKRRMHVFQNQKREANIKIEKNSVENNNLQPLRTILKTSVPLQIAGLKNTGKKEHNNVSSLII